MIEFLQSKIAQESSAEKKINLLRELLQLLCLKILHDKSYFANMAFVGGTALRVLFDMKRFSEDLDFSLINNTHYDFTKMIKTLERELKSYALDVNIKNNASKTAQSSMLKFPELLNAVGLSNLKEQNVSIKLEIDSNPPDGWQIESSLINKTYVINITHLNLPSLYAAKLHACFFRRYTKGRDFYDMLWYLGKKIKPNYILLNNAIQQTHPSHGKINENNIKNFLLEKIKKIDFDTVKKDVGRFLEDKNELKLLDGTVISKAVQDCF
ncbi:MAG: nucleotidyl transferase AbiEii/AbiGii toxin family protein [Candidatus Omnitrophica bacterium]|nr:nucleotidyl transferase AbiEii/AbiGii toxin family protein [Candidatus Omnitrophota bacterium]